MAEPINLAKIASEVRDDLNRIYRFGQSRAGIYTFDPNNPDPKLMEILRATGVTDEQMGSRLAEYISGEVGGTCAYTFGALGRDYIILIPAKTAPEGKFYLEIGEETMHGEHATEHRRGEKYTDLFSGVAREFFGGSGACHMARKVCDIPQGEPLPEQFWIKKVDYNKGDDTFHFDCPHILGYALAKEAMGGDPDWKAAMFHEPDERRMWRLYNEVVVPTVRILIPPALENGDELRRDIEGYVTSLGLRSVIDFAIDHSDTRGVKGEEKPKQE